MIQKRKVVLGAVAALVVLIAFAIYTKLADTSPIVPPDNFRNAEPLKTPEFTSGAEIANNQIGDVTYASFVARDEATQKITRIFGFEKLLNPEKNSEKWRLRNPYMEFFGEKNRCKIYSKEGEFQVQTVLGTTSPQSGRLYDDVRIELTFENNGRTSEGIIYLDDMDYDSERSEISTNNSVRAEFEHATMVGEGMVLIYNTAKARIEFFELIDLHYIRVRDVEMLSKSDRETKEGTSVAKKEAITAPQQTTEQPESVSAGSNQTSAEPVFPEEVKEQAINEDDLYQCRFRKDVTIEHAGELVVVGRTSININNIIFNSASSESSKTNQEPDDSESGPTAATQVEYNTSKPVMVKKQTPADSDETAVIAEQGGKEVLITCDGGFIVEPMENVVVQAKAAAPRAKDVSYTDNALKKPYDISKTFKGSINSNTKEIFTVSAGLPDFENIPEPVYAGFAGQTDSEPSKPTRFHAERIDYDMISGNAVARGPVSLLLYVSENSEASGDRSPQKQVPINITASDNVKYFSVKDRAVFNGNVVGTRILRQSDGSVVENNLYGDQMLVDLQSDSGSGNSIRHLTVLGEEVVLDLKKKADKGVLNHIRLICDKLEYGSTDEVVLATGPGRIEINNENAPIPQNKSNNSLSIDGPCYAWIQNFDFLKWSTSINKIVADASSASMAIQYVPLVEGKPSKPVYVVASHIEANFMQTLQGRTQLAALTADNGIAYNEEDGHAFEGNRLFYNVNNSILLITGTKDELCKANGMPTERIKYNLATRQLVTGIAGPGSFSLPPKERK